MFINGVVKLTYSPWRFSQTSPPRSFQALLALSRPLDRSDMAALALAGLVCVAGVTLHVPDRPRGLADRARRFWKFVSA